MANIALIASISEIDSVQWDALADGDPFASHDFYLALEQSNSVGAGTGWQPYYLTHTEAGQLKGAMPLFVKTHSQGEYVFDHAFADAFERAGGQYYPKLVAAAPFTPINGNRILGDARLMIDQALMLGQSNGLSSLHVNFSTDNLVDPRLHERHGVQYHFRNDGYADFDEFLSQLSASKRKSLRKERREAVAGLDVAMKLGHELTAADWDCFWACYQDTGARKWGTPYLTREFFDIISSTMANKIVMAMAYQDGRPVASALNFRDEHRLLGRYWGSLIDQKFLHFELAYYQAIEFAINNQLRIVEAGAQGEHKIARGYRPEIVKSYHHFFHPEFHRVVGEYIIDEREDLARYCVAAAQGLPFRTCE